MEQIAKKNDPAGDLRRRGALSAKALIAHRSVDKHTTHKIDHTIYSVIEE